MLIWIERLCLACRALLLLGLGVNAVYSNADANRAIEAIQAQRDLTVPAPATGLWSAARRAQHNADAERAIAVLRIPSQQLTVPVLRAAPTMPL